MPQLSGRRVAGVSATMRTRRRSTRERARQDTVFRALADPTRREILGLLRGNRRSVTEIASNFRMSRPAVSKHVRQLRSAGLVIARREGVAQMCELNPRPLRVVRDWLLEYEKFWDENLQRLKAYVEENP